MSSRTVKRIVSGARVDFDPRTTAEAHSSRDPKNYMAEQEPQRRARWEAKQNAKQG